MKIEKIFFATKEETGSAVDEWLQPRPDHQVPLAHREIERMVIEQV